MCEVLKMWATLIAARKRNCYSAEPAYDEALQIDCKLSVSRRVSYEIQLHIYTRRLSAAMAM
jgi:hypothetical protein